MTACHWCLCSSSQYSRAVAISRTSLERFFCWSRPQTAFHISNRINLHNHSIPLMLFEHDHCQIFRLVFYFVRIERVCGRERICFYENFIEFIDTVEMRYYFSSSWIPQIANRYIATCMSIQRSCTIRWSLSISPSRSRSHSHSSNGNIIIICYSQQQ